MKKEVLIAIFTGFAIGLIGTIIIHFVRNASAPDENITPIPTSTQDADNTISNTHVVTIITPFNNEVSDSETVNLKGNTSAGAMVSVIGSKLENTIVADTAGNFSVPLELQPGPNTFLVESYNEAGEKAETIFEITYSTADLNQTEDDETETAEQAEDEEAEDE